MNAHTAITPIKPVAPYQGGKRILAPQIIEHINAIPHKSYIEPFCGMGGVFFRRNQKPSCEVINDLNGEIANFFRILQRHYVPFMDMLRYTLTSRKEFERLLEVKPNTLTDLERAARFLYLQKTAFGGRVVGQAFGVQVGTGSRFNLSRLEPLLEEAFERLTGVVIESLPYEKCIERYDSPNSLFYLDPPYWGTEGEYGKALFSQGEYKKLAKQLSSIKGKFIFSINDTGEIREIFSSFQFQEVAVTYSLAKSKSKKTKELIFFSSH